MSKRMVIGGIMVAFVVSACNGADGGSQNSLVPAASTAPSGAAGASAEPAATVDPAASASADADASAPAEAAPSEEASAGGAFTVGDRVKLGDEEYITFEKAEKGFKSKLVKPGKGNMNVSLLIAFEGINPSGSSYNPFYFKIKDDNGFEYNYSPFGKEPQLSSSNDLQPGKTARGWMTFEVPKDTKSLTVSYVPGLIGDPVEFVYKP